MKLLEFKLINQVTDTYPYFYARIKYSYECGYLWWKKTKVSCTNIFKYYDWYISDSATLSHATCAIAVVDSKFIAQLERELDIALTDLAHKTRKEPAKVIRGCSI